MFAYGIFFTLATWAVAGGILWFLAYQFVPVGFETPFSKAILILLLSTIFASVANACLGSLSAVWLILLNVAFLGLLVRIFLRITLIRSMATSITFFIVMVCVLGGIGFILKQYNYLPASAHHSRSQKS